MERLSTTKNATNYYSFRDSQFFNKNVFRDEASFPRTVFHYSQFILVDNKNPRNDQH